MARPTLSAFLEAHLVAGRDARRHGPFFTPMPFATSLTLFVEFGQPEHGWLPVTFKAGEFELAFDASDVPANPLDLLCEALAVVPAGGSAKVMWHLEPAVYWFAFEQHADGVALEITEASGYNQPGICLLQLTGSVQAVLRPFYKALTAFAAYRYSEPHWPALAASRLKPLGQLLRSQH